MCRWLEPLIFTCRVLDTLCVVLLFHIVYYYVITSYNNPSNLLMVVWSFKAHQVAGAVSISLIQTLYAIRIWTLYSAMNQATCLTRCIIPLMIALFVCLGFAATIAVSYEICVGQNAGASTLLARQWITIYPLSVYTGIDAVIAASQCWILYHSRTALRGVARIRLSLTSWYIPWTQEPSPAYVLSQESLASK